MRCNYFAICLFRLLEIVIHAQSSTINSIMWTHSQAMGHYKVLHANVIQTPNKRINDCQRSWCNSNEIRGIMSVSVWSLGRSEYAISIFRSEIHFASHFRAVLVDVGPFLISRFSNSRARTNSFRKHATAVTAWAWNSLRTIYLLKFYLATGL